MSIRIGQSPLARGIAILFLLYTGIDIACPQLCSEELITVASAEETISSDFYGQALVPYQYAVSAREESQRNEVPDQKSQDEDCFCCCAHVLPGTVFVTPAVPERKLIVWIQTEFVTPQSELARPYHPPRFS